MRRLLQPLALLALVLALARPVLPLRAESAAEKIRLDASGNFVDGHGRFRIFRGINSVQKSPPWYSKQILNATLLRAYEDWGFNVVRLGTMWQGAQPNSSTAFDQSYLNKLASIVDTLAGHGMYAIMDMHQDVLTSKYGAYDGIPRWLVDSFPPPPQPYPWPFKRVPSWPEGYLTWAVSSAFQHLYSNTSSALEHWSAFWLRVAGAVSAKPTVLGYELINEPWAGDVYSRPPLLLPGRAGAENLLPAYDLLSRRLAVADPETLVFYEPVTWALALGGTGAVGTGFERTPAHRPGSSVLSFHYYCWLLTPASAERPYPTWQRLLCDSLLLQRTLANAEEVRRTTGGGKFLTEFGTCAPNGMANSTGTVECNEVLAQADKWQLSWTYWDSNFTLGNGSFNQDVVRSFARPYPRATAGRPIRFEFDLASARFSFSFSYNASVKAATEVFLPMSVHYPRGADISVSSGFTHSLSGNILRLRPKAAAATGDIVALAVTRRK